MKKLFVLFVIISAASCGSGNSSEKNSDSLSKKPSDSLNMPADTLKGITDTTRMKDTTNRP